MASVRSTVRDNSLTSNLVQSAFMTSDLAQWLWVGNRKQADQMLNWFNSLVTAAVVLTLIISTGSAAMGLQTFEPLELAGAVFLLLMLAVLLKLVGRRSKRDK
jgi:hypothetical protein